MSTLHLPINRLYSIFGQHLSTWSSLTFPNSSLGIKTCSYDCGTPFTLLTIKIWYIEISVELKLKISIQSNQIAQMRHAKQQVCPRQIYTYRHTHRSIMTSQQLTCQIRSKVNLETLIFQRLFPPCINFIPLKT